MSICARLALSGLCIVTFTCTASAAPECWGVKEFSGVSAMSVDGYVPAANRLPGPVVVCFSEKTGTAVGNDVPLTRMGSSTLAGMTNNGVGGETMVVYQLNRDLRKMTLLQTRVGTDTMVPLLPDIASLFVGERFASSRSRVFTQAAP